MERGDGVLAVAVGPQHERALDGVAAAVPARARRAADVDIGAPAQRDRPRRQAPEPVGAVEDLPHALPVLKAVAQLEQLAAPGRAGERGEEADGGLVTGAGRGGHGVTVEVVGPAAGAAPRARDGGQAAWWASRASPSAGGLVGGGLVAGLTVGGLAAGEELDALGDDVDPRGVAAVLGLELVEQQAAVDSDLAPGLQVLRARRWPGRRST